MAYVLSFSFSAELIVVLQLDYSLESALARIEQYVPDSVARVQAAR